MKKIVALIVMVLLLSGCNATYNLEIYNDSYKEELTVKSLGADTTGLSEWNIPVNADEENLDVLLTTAKVTGVTYYDKSSEFTNGYYKYTYYHEFAMEDYYKSYFAVSSYDFFAVFTDDTDESGKKDLITITTSLENLPFAEYEDLEKITVNIKTNHRVYSSNADSHQNYTYTWNIDRNNYEKKSVQIRIYKDKYVLNYNNEVTKKLYIFLIILGVLLLAMGIVALRMRKANKI
ncbi:MAG TPA: membrane lipoprotein lipid attachment site-containing protein [Bacilli bacterium]|nr:membrane lipoprotein lipid attachment site-containing protein [Bacilli bacterium]